MMKIQHLNLCHTRHCHLLEILTVGANENAKLEMWSFVVQYVISNY